jgi:hypothetical protein
LREHLGLLLDQLCRFALTDKLGKAFWHLNLLRVAQLRLHAGIVG